MIDTFRPKGIIGVVQTPFLADGDLDESSLVRLIESAISAGVDGFLAPAVASEVACLTSDERRRIVNRVVELSAGRVPVIAGASAGSVDESVALGQMALAAGVDAFLASVPEELYRRPILVPGYFESIASRVDLPLVIQDLQWNGPGLEIACIKELATRIPHLAGFKIETVPAGAKYTQVREALGADVFLAGGWAVAQMIEALDRGVDAMMPECSMIAVYAKIDRLHRTGRRDEAVELFRRLLPVLTFTNQEIRTSIAFFKKLLVRKGLFLSATMRGDSFRWDEYNRRIADELIDDYLTLEAGL